MKKILIGAAVGTAGLLALTGATFAHTDGETPGSGVRDRVAEILGIAPDELQDAVRQARDEQRDEQMAERLASAVEGGVISQLEADAVTAWLDAMPEALDGVAGYGRGNGVGHIAGAAASEEQIAALVDRLVEAEKITEAEGSAVTAWLGDAPSEALSKLRPDHGERGERGERGHGPSGDRGHGRGFSGRMFGEGPGGGLFEGRFQIRPYVPSVDADDAGGAGTSTSAALGDLA
ncbi:MAG: hypothetical protein O3B04_03100 [Chloroflexi bacterium]|nr:hypothetical protein [Chloroflexota bacterium]